MGNESPTLMGTEQEMLIKDTEEEEIKNIIMNSTKDNELYQTMWPRIKTHF